jgi:hypothetical protein
VGTTLRWGACISPADSSRKAVRITLMQSRIVMCCKIFFSENIVTGRINLFNPNFNF